MRAKKEAADKVGWALPVTENAASVSELNVNPFDGFIKITTGHCQVCSYLNARLCLSIIYLKELPNPTHFQRGNNQ
jgi:hypothetical protein